MDVLPRRTTQPVVLAPWATAVVYGRRRAPFWTLLTAGLAAGPLVVVAGAVLAAGAGHPPSVPLGDGGAVRAEVLRWAVGGLVAGAVAVVVRRLGWD